MTLTRRWRGALLGEREKTDWSHWVWLRPPDAPGGILGAMLQNLPFLLLTRNWGSLRGLSWWCSRPELEIFQLSETKQTGFNIVWAAFAQHFGSIVRIDHPPHHTVEIIFLTKPGRDAETLYFTCRTISKSPTAPALTAVKTPPKAAWIYSCIGRTSH